MWAAAQQFPVFSNYNLIQNQLESAVDSLRAVSFIFNLNLITIQLDSAVGCLGAVSFHFRLEFI